MARLLIQSLKAARRVVALVVGSTVVLVGVVFLVTPGPGVAAILIGLGILATEFVWARRLLRRFKSSGQDLARAAGLGGNKPNREPGGTDTPPN